MKKLAKIFVISAVVLVIGATSVTALAAPGYGPRSMMTGFNDTAKGADSANTNNSTDLDAFKAKRLEQMKTYLDAKVAAGTMTQAQEDAILNHMKQRQQNCTGRGNGYGMMGPRSSAGYGMHRYS